MILIDATYINVTGGKLLLLEFLKKLSFCKDDVIIILDRRMKGDIEKFSTQWQIFFVHGSLITRTQRLLLLNQQFKFRSIFFFNGIPPIIRFKKISTYAYFQNTTIFSSFAKNLYFKFFQKNVDTWIFQTEKTKEKFLANYQCNTTKVLPFFQNNIKEVKTIRKMNTHFFYPTSNHPHKNNDRLIEAFVLLYEKGIQVKLEITLKRENYNGKVTPNIKFLGNLKKEEIMKMYEKGYTIIHPSLEESFGMVLIEACQYHLNVLTADLPYVYQLIKPSDTFDPFKTESIISSIEKAANNPKLISGELIVKNHIKNLINLISQPNV